MSNRDKCVKTMSKIIYFMIIYIYASKIRCKGNFVYCFSLLIALKLIYLGQVHAYQLCQNYDKNGFSFTQKFVIITSKFKRSAIKSYL